MSDQRPNPYPAGHPAPAPVPVPAERPAASWREAFVVELRILDVTGDRIGSALAEVDAHCADSGETPQQAFGDPAAYARALGLPRTAVRGPDPLTVAATLAGVLGLLVWIKLSSHWDMKDVDVSGGNLGVVGVLGALALLLVVARRRAENAVLRAPVLAPAIAAGLLMGGAVAADGLFPRTVATLDWWLLAATGTVLLLLNVAHHLLTPSREDPVRSPDGSATPEGRDVSRADRAMRTSEPWVFLGATAGVVLAGYLVR